MNKKLPAQEARKEIRTSVTAETHKRVRVAAAESERSIADFVEGLIEEAIKERR